MLKIDKGRRVVGAERDELTREMADEYEAGSSIRSLSADSGRSFGAVHRLLTEAGVSLRPRGGAHRARAV